MLTEQQIIDLLVETLNSITVEKDKNNIKNMMRLVDNYRNLKSLLPVELTVENQTTISTQITYFEELLTHCTNLYNQSLVDREIGQSSDLVRLVRSINNLLRQDNFEEII